MHKIISQIDGPSQHAHSRQRRRASEEVHTFVSTLSTSIYSIYLYLLQYLNLTVCMSVKKYFSVVYLSISTCILSTACIP